MDEHDRIINWLTRRTADEMEVAAAEAITRLRTALEEAKRQSVRIYNSGYHAGHHDTVEGQYTHILPCDMDTYHGDVVAALEAERDQLLARIEGTDSACADYAFAGAHTAREIIEKLHDRIRGYKTDRDLLAEANDQLRAELETERMKLAMKAPITFEVACKAWGDVPSLCGDTTRRCFFAVWALLCFEWAEAMVEHAQSRKVGAGMARNPLRDATIDAALAAKGE